MNADTAKLVRRTLMTVGAALTGFGIATPEEVGTIADAADHVIVTVGLVTNAGAIIWSWVSAIKSYLVKRKESKQ